MELKLEEKRELLALARDAIARKLEQNEVLEERFSSGLRQNGGAFVSLHKNGQLRGCIGSFPGKQSLGHIVGRMAQAAAFDDPRFPPLSREELEHIDLEISVLSPLVRSDPAKVEIGKHGICLVSPRGRGVLLPQVATGQGWDRITFLQQTCRKAGLPKDAWQDQDVEVYLFSAQVFGEKL